MNLRINLVAMIITFIFGCATEPTQNAIESDSNDRSAEEGISASKRNKNIEAKEKYSELPDHLALADDVVDQLQDANEISPEIANCLKEWNEEMVLTVKQARGVRKVGSETNITRRIEIEEIASDAIDLVYVKIRGELIDKIELDLMNPNGYYCIDIDVKMARRVDIESHCDATVVESKMLFDSVGKIENSNRRSCRAMEWADIKQEAMLPPIAATTPVASPSPATVSPPNSTATGNAEASATPATPAVPETSAEIPVGVTPANPVVTPATEVVAQ